MATCPVLTKAEIRAQFLQSPRNAGPGFQAKCSYSEMYMFNRSMLVPGSKGTDAEDRVYAHMTPEDHRIQRAVGQRFFNMNGEKENGFIDGLSPEALFRLLDEEAATRPRGSAHYSEIKAERKHEGKCPLPGHGGHSEENCRTVKAKTQRTPFKEVSKKRERAPGESRTCNLCNGQGHLYRDCPHLAAAQQSAAAAAPRAIANVAATATDARSLTEADLQRLANIVMERSGRAAERKSGEDSGTAADARAFVVSAFCRSHIVQLGLDTMANRHLVFDRSLFDQTTLKTLTVPLLIAGVCGDVEVWEYGTTVLDGIRLNNVFYCPSTPVNVIYIAALRDQFPSWKASMPPGGVEFHDASGHLKIKALIVNGLYLWHLNGVAVDTPTTRAKARALLAELERGAAVAAVNDATDVNVPLAEASAVNSFASFMFMHRVLGHPSLKRMRWLQKVFPRIAFGQFPPSIFCDACNEGKSKRGSLPVMAPEGNKLPFDFWYDRAHVDIKMSTTGGWNEIRFTAIIFSEKTGFVWALHARTKDEIAGKIMAWLLMYNLHYAPTNGPIALFRADNEKALFPKSAEEFWSGYGVILSFSAAYTPGHNNRAESAIRTTYMTARCLVRDSPLEDLYWPFAVDHACFLLARRPTSAAPQTTPYGRIMRRAPTLPTLAFGTLGHWTPPAAHPMQAGQHTFSPRGFACHFLGFEANSDTTMVIVCDGVIYKTIDVWCFLAQVLFMTRDERTGSTNHNAAAPVTSIFLV